ncbi:hypothetical protein [Dongia sp.]|uniref:hypothetical protein n=1 Tax=Dongia sp. TaxID=1977262 RepID=UPI00375003AD
MLRTFANGSIEYFIDRDRSLVFSRWEGDFRGEELLATLPSLWREFPEIGRWDAIHDMLDFAGFLEHRYTREMISLRAELVPGFDPQVRTAVVSADPMKTFEIKVTKASAPDRHFGLFGSNADALDWMIAEQPERPRDSPLPWWFDRKPAANPAPVR